MFPYFYPLPSSFPLFLPLFLLLYIHIFNDFVRYQEGEEAHGGRGRVSQLRQDGGPAAPARETAAQNQRTGTCMRAYTMRGYGEGIVNPLTYWRFYRPITCR